ncbi:MAG TPA: hypothetical protein VI336_02245 [Candidatus Saccharimonadales bacterium]|nr:hypothetical protein [Candidatus Saccharimonadales bacterium]
MTDNIYLLIFLIIDVFILGFLAAIAARHARAHFRSERHRPETQQPVANFDLPPDVKERLTHESQAQFQSVVTHSSAELEHQLKDSASQINSLIKSFATDIVESEMQRYREELDRLRARADAEMGGLREEMAKHETELKAKMAAEIEAEKGRLIKQIDTKLADAVTSFLTEALGRNIDLGNQTEYLLSLLEEHKAELIKEVGNEARAAR